MKERVNCGLWPFPSVLPFMAALHRSRFNCGLWPFPSVLPWPARKELSNKGFRRDWRLEKLQLRFRFGGIDPFFSSEHLHSTKLPVRNREKPHLTRLRNSMSHSCCMDLSGLNRCAMSNVH